MKGFVQTIAGDHILVSTVYIEDTRKYETLVFKWDVDANKVLDYDEYEHHEHDDAEDACECFEEVVHKWENETKKLMRA